MTTDDVGDPTALPDLLDQIDGPIARFIPDGAYDGAPTRDLLATRLGEIVEVIIPPPKTAVQSPQSAEDPSIRDRHIAEIETKGRMAWQKSPGYNKRSRIETGEWIQVGSVNREPVIGVTVNRLRRPWVDRPPEDGAPGYLYDIELRANDRLFDYPAVLENTEGLHAQLCHLGLDAFEQSIRLTLPAVLGSGRVIEVVEQFIKSATYGVRRGRNPITPKAQALADEWPEYVLGPHDALMYLGPG